MGATIAFFFFLFLYTLYLIFFTRQAAARQKRFRTNSLRSPVLPCWYLIISLLAVIRCRCIILFHRIPTLSLKNIYGLDYARFHCLSCAAMDGYNNEQHIEHDTFSPIRTGQRAGNKDRQGIFGNICSSSFACGDGEELVVPQRENSGNKALSYTLPYASVTVSS